DGGAPVPDGVGGVAQVAPQLGVAQRLVRGGGEVRSPAQRVLRRGGRLRPHGRHAEVGGGHVGRPWARKAGCHGSAWVAARTSARWATWTSLPCRARRPPMFIRQE